MGDSRLPEAVRDGLAAAARAARVRVLLVRRHRSRPGGDGPLRVFAAWSDPVAPWLESGRLAVPEDVLDLDLAALGEGASPGLTPCDGMLIGVCTHGRHDACCAERGRPVAAAVAAAYPEETWECSHVGGDRFAGNAVVWPHGLYYGRLDQASGVAMAQAHARGEVLLDRLRGRSGFPMPVQAAEVALRQALGESGLDAVRLRGRTRSGDVTRVTFDVVGSGRHVVDVRSRVDGDPHRLTCRATRPSPIPAHDIVRIARPDDGGASG